jgi:hypothetical protein
MTDVDKLVALGMAPELASAVVALITAATPSAAEINAAVSAKTEIAALTGSSTAANIVTALQA